MTETMNKRVSDVLLWFVDARFCMEDLTIEGYDLDGTADQAITIAPGTPVQAETSHNYVPTISTGESGVDAIALENKDIAAGETASVRCLVRGPAVLDKDQLPSSDQNDDDYTIADLVTALKSLDIICRDEPDNTES